MVPDPHPFKFLLMDYPIEYASTVKAISTFSY
ncbi:hypothetical protein CLV51_103272 [Chitinophaga niastensis]|uniref:Uncharacterized protein n=1 Tax=Chitinophaga niastensis TaxID=536980 RepID=A0A2P8HJA4_CHINA|nr:hypothetical protein CLV51_103272 [Chitinophaga niastensis]